MVSRNRDGFTEAKRGSEKKRGQDEPIENWPFRQGVIAWQKIWAKL